MVRALPIERAGGRYHGTTRGNERKPIYRTDADQALFLELLGEAVERFGLGQLAGALDYAAVGQAVSRFGAGGWSNGVSCARFWRRSRRNCQM